MNSCLYLGQVKHRRYTPVSHAFSYRLFMLYLDLDELPWLFSRYWLWSAQRPALARFRRADHLGDRNTGLADAVRNLVADKTGVKLAGPIRLLTNLRYFGYGFNPVSFYYCFDADDSSVEVIVAEVNNTPWGEQHCYILPESINRGHTRNKRFLVDKDFHVSPFMGMDVDYDWRFSPPGEHLVIHKKNIKDGQALFGATLMLDRKPIGSHTLAGVLIRYPFMTLRIVVAIYFQALLLWLKKTPLYPHPDKHPTPESVIKP